MSFTKRTITEIHFNWFSLSECGEEYREHKVGKEGVKAIRNECTDSVACYAVDFEDGRCEIVYNPNRVFYSAVNKEQQVEGILRELARR